MTARCKFIIESVTHHAYGGRTIRLDARYDQPLSEEGRAFSNATPTGQMEIVVQNDRVFDLFQPGRHVYVDVTAAE